jgi:serine protease Do
MNLKGSIARHTFAFPIVCSLLLLIPAPHPNLFAKPAQDEPKVEVQPAPITRDHLGLSFAPVVKKVSPSVVTIYSNKKVKESPNNSMLNDPFFRRFFGMDEDSQQSTRRGPRTREEQSLGSGVIVSADGYILSNSHVVEGADEVKVGLPNGQGEVTAKVIGSDPPTDIAVLKVAATNLTPITMTDSENVQVGDVVLAVGNPFGVGQTVTMGIVSALGRGGFGVVDYEDFIQTDASINPGNSGGPLIDTEGRLVGINTFILSGSGGSMGIGFAVPINMARYVMERINQEGRVARGFLGIYVQPVTPDLARAFNLKEQSGALVGGVSSGSPAARAGLKAGDVITEYNGKKITDSRHLRLEVAQTRPNSEVELKLLRDGKAIDTKVLLSELSSEQAAAPAPHTRSSAVRGQGLSFQGVELADMDSKVRQQLGIAPEVKGALIIAVERDSKAYDAGVRPGDVILEINNQKIASAKDAIEQSRKSKDHVLMRLWSRGGNRYAAFDLKGGARG